MVLLRWLTDSFHNCILWFLYWLQSSTLAPLLYVRVSVCMFVCLLVRLVGVCLVHKTLVHKLHEFLFLLVENVPLRF